MFLCNVFWTVFFKILLLNLLGLRNAFWPGRCNIVKRPNVTFYLDGAHTPGSIEVRWMKRFLVNSNNLSHCLSVNSVAVQAFSRHLSVRLY